MSDNKKRKPAVTLENVHDIFADFETQVPPLGELRKYYTEDMVFQDPIQRIEGLVPFYKMNDRVIKRTYSLKFEPLKTAQAENIILYTYRFIIKPYRWLRYEMLIEGVTEYHLNDEGKIFYHRDHWDFLGTFMDSIPGLKWIYRKIIPIMG